jgi:hypothetical protein
MNFGDFVDITEQHTIIPTSSVTTKCLFAFGDNLSYSESLHEVMDLFMGTDAI